MVRSMRLPLTIMLLACAAFVGCVDPAVRRGQAALGRGAYRIAITAFVEVRQREGPSPALDAALASAHRRQLLDDAHAGKCDASAGHLSSAEELSAIVLADHHALLRCREAHGGGEATRVAELEALIAAGDSRAHIYHALMRLHMQAGRDAEALALLNPLEERFALSAVDRRGLAEALVRMGAEARALQQLQRIKADDPMNPVLRLRIAALLEKTGVHVEAERVFETLVADYPKNPVIFLQMARFYRRIGRAQAATGAQSQADELRGVVPVERILRPLRKSRR
ncbi:MAG: tetratricopeptide (TPR) repeat protein [Bradymonadia bacterium]|jgi:tetratricopeptide (TPR) repeat protein